jgi:urate oxidase
MPKRSTTKRSPTNQPSAKKSPAKRPTPSSRPVLAALGENSYGKSRIRLMKVSRSGMRHIISELSVDIALEGDFDAVHTRGDNSNCLPTDTMKNTVYALGKSHPIETIESFGLHLGRHFVSRNQQVDGARVAISQIAWDRVQIGGREHPHCFTKGSDERQTCEVAIDEQGADIVSGIHGLVILKSTDSAFSGYLKDEFTTLPETRDRIMCTSITADWLYTDEAVRSDKPDFALWRAAIRKALIAAFAGHKSESVQQTLFAMGESALAACKQIERIRLSLPNKHCLLVNLKPFGLDNDNEIFVPTDEPHGLIEATIERL